jgi:hypothetical protein
MLINGMATVKRATYKRTDNGKHVTNFTLLIPTTAFKDQTKKEFRRDLIDADLWGELAHAWDGFEGIVRFEGDLRINRYKKGDTWECKPTVSLRWIRSEEGESNE